MLANYLEFSVKSNPFEWMNERVNLPSVFHNDSIQQQQQNEIKTDNSNPKKKEK